MLRALVLVACALLSASSFAQEVPKTKDLPRLQHELRAALQPLSDAQFTGFAQRVFYEAGSIAEVDWPRVMNELRGEAVQRRLPDATLAYFDMQQAYYVAAVQRDREGALAIVDAALARYHGPDCFRPELALLAENIERDAEHWNGARKYLALAEEALAGAAGARGRAMRSRASTATRRPLWIDLGMPELARPHVEIELERTRGSQDPSACMRACVNELKLLLVEENDAALDERAAALPRQGWYAELAPAEQGICLLQVAASWLSREHYERAPHGTAARLLDELLEEGKIDATLRPWVVRHRAVCAADEGDWTRARALCDELVRAIRKPGVPADELPAGRLGAAWIALEARIALAESVGASDRAQRLRPHLDRLRRAWSEFLADWSGSPVRGGGLAYLGLGERHQILQELIELELAVAGESPVATRGASTGATRGASPGATRALEEVLAAEEQSTLSRRMQLAHVTLDEVHRELDAPRSGVLVYLPSRDRSFVFALDARGVRVFHLDAAHRLRLVCRDLVAAAQIAVHDGHGLDDRELVSAAANAARALLPTALEEQIADWDTLLVVGIDDIAYVPFELLPAGERETQGTRRAISYCHSIPLAAHLARQATEPRHGRARLVLASLAAADDGRTALELDAREREDLARALPGESEVLAGTEVELARLGLAPGEDMRLLYVLAHGTHDPQRERPGGLRLASASAPGSTASTAWAEDIEALRAPPLVLLTSCGAGRAPLRRGDGGRSDLAAAFLFAGASCVVLPTCDLRLDATLRVVPLVFRSLSASRTAAESLREARVELVQRGDSVAALQAHLLHVTGRGETRAFAPGAGRGAGAAMFSRWWLALPLFAVGAWFVLRRARKRGLRA